VSHTMSVAAAASAVLAVGLLTYVARAGLIVALADRSLPAELLRALRFVGPAVLSALVVSLLAGGEGISGIDLDEVVAVAVGALVAARTRNLIASLAGGMIALWVLILVR
jgi:branched-subunit amino acid transport protein